MEINASNVGQNFYFVDKTTPSFSSIEYGTLKSVLPKYSFKDAYGSVYKRENNILFDVYAVGGGTVLKVVTNENLIFTNINDAIQYCAVSDVFFGYSVLKKGEC